MSEITENTPPTLLAQLSALPLQPYASVSTILGLIIILAIFKSVFDKDEKFIPGYEVVGVYKDDTPLEAKQRYAENSRSILQEGLKKHGDSFQVYTPTGPMIVLSRKYINEIRNHKLLSFQQNINKATFASLPGVGLMSGMAGFIFDVHSSEVFKGLVRTQLTQSLGRITADLSSETAVALEEYFPPRKDWQRCVFYPTTVDLVSRLSARVFLGEGICRNKEWLKVSGAYAVEGIEFIRVLRFWKPILRPIVQFFLSERRQMIKSERVARRIINDELERRIVEQTEDARVGRPVRKYDDALQWLQDWRQKSGQKFDIVGGQLGLGLGAIHTTSMALTRVLYDLIDNPEWIQPLRDEVKRVLEEDGEWKKTTLHKLKLMDSVMKESQRRSPVHLTIMTRIAEADVTFSDGLKVRKGDMLTVTTPEVMMDPELFPEPERFIGNRFLKLRQMPGNENKWQYVTTSTEHFGFGHGEHSCPGRFFAGNELKVALAHMLLKYDWKFAQGHDSRNIERAQDIIPNPIANVMFKERQPELQL